MEAVGADSVRITKKLFTSIVTLTPSVPPESGGILGEKDGVICAFHFDDSIQTTLRAAYIPNIPALNQKIRQWAGEGISFCGLFHSHPNGQDVLSEADIAYITRILCVNPVKSLYFPLVFPGCKMLFYRAEYSNDHILLHQVNIHILN